MDDIFIKCVVFSQEAFNLRESFNKSLENSRDGTDSIAKGSKTETTDKNWKDILVSTKYPKIWVTEILRTGIRNRFSEPDMRLQEPNIRFQ